MSEANVAIELHYFLWTIAVVFVSGIALGALVQGGKTVVLSLVQATAFTAVGMLATIGPNEIDGQTGLGIPMMWLPFFVVSWLGLVIGAKLRSQLGR